MTPAVKPRVVTGVGRRKPPHAEVAPSWGRLASAMLIALVVLVAGRPVVAAQQDPNATVVGGATSDCPAVAGIFLAGTWETTSTSDSTQPVGLLAPVATALEQQLGAEFTAVFPAYPAKAMDGVTYGDSENLAVSAAAQAVSGIADRCKATKFVLAGYSQGADAAGDLAAEIGCHRTPITPERVLAVGLVADPKQGTSGGNLVGPALQGNGIRGVRASGFCALGAVTAEFCATDDRFCATSATGNPILAALGRLLSQPTTTSAPAKANTDTEKHSSAMDTASRSLTRSLDSGFSATDLTGLPTAISTVIDAIRTGHADQAALEAAAGSARDALTGLADLSYFLHYFYPALSTLTDPLGPFHACAANQHTDSPSLRPRPRSGG
ncbi:cutinase family protein [Nocardia sp. alder85J]|uniref:cutinase family protein n=1 Tax=Nocardia sp. alder85J TaxID=2862949 RepID=UPI001CD4F301|nr:cutinase family protein [Nocardia sp. alder85J]MCX4093605.1 cutinase family protein [Nocardia sp. alder85J]